MLTLRIFLSSPGDVAEERRKAREVVDRIVRGPNWRNRAFIDLMSWDDEAAPTPMDATCTPQDSVSRYAGRPADCDLTVVLLWSRIGSPLPPSVRRADGSIYESGTVWELEEARGAGKPVWIYRCQRRVMLDADAPDLQVRRAQRDAVKRFFESFVEADQSITGGVNSYDTPDDFAQHFGQHLEAELRRRSDELEQIEAARNATVSDAVLAQAVIDPCSVFARVDVDRFVGRGWLIDSINRFVECNSQGLVIIEAAAGMGKTALMAYLATQRKPVCHFCELAPGIDGVSAALRSIGAQLIQRWGLPRALLDEVLPGYATRADFLQRLLFDAARERNRASPGQPIVVLVDALDEAGTPPGQNVLGLPRRLPDGVFFIVSMRPVPVALIIEAPRAVLRLEAGDSRNVSDVGTYLSAAAQRPAIAAELKRLGCSEPEFEERLLRISRGIWIYLYYVLREIESGIRMPLDLATLPEGIWQYYAQFWQHWRRRNPELWASLALDVLGVLAAAREDLDVDQIIALLQPAPKDAAVLVYDLVERHWSPFLARSSSSGKRLNAFRLYHASLREFLTGHFPCNELTTGEQALGRELAHATARAHERIVKVLGDLVEGREGPPSLRLYAVHHLVAHLLAVGRLDAVGRLLRAARKTLIRKPFGHDDEVITEAQPLWYAQNMALGNAEGFAGGIEAWLRAMRDGRRGAPTVDEFFGRYTLASLRRQAELVPPALLQALCESGVWTHEQALAHMRLCTDELRRRDDGLAVFPLLGAVPGNWLFACDLARAFAEPDYRVELFATLFEVAPPDRQPAAAAELLQHARTASVTPHLRDIVLARLTLYWDALAEEGLAALCLQAIGDLDVLFRRLRTTAAAPSVGWWYRLLDRTSNGGQVMAALRLAGVAVVADGRGATLASQWEMQGRWQHTLAVAVACADARLAARALAAIESNYLLAEVWRLPQRSEIVVALQALDLLPDDEGLPSTVAFVMSQTLQLVRGEAETDDEIIDAIGSLRTYASRAAMQAWLVESAPQTVFTAMANWLLQPERKVRNVPTDVDTASEAWQAYMLRAMARHGADAGACAVRIVTMHDPVFIAEALGPLSGELPRPRRRRALRHLAVRLRIEQPEADRLEPLLDHLEPWFECDSELVIEELWSACNFTANPTMLRWLALSAAEFDVVEIVLEACLTLPAPTAFDLASVLRACVPDEAADWCRLKLRKEVSERMVVLAATFLSESRDVADLLTTAMRLASSGYDPDGEKLIGGLLASGLILGCRGGAADDGPLMVLLERLAHDNTYDAEALVVRTRGSFGEGRYLDDDDPILLAIAQVPISGDNLGFFATLERRGLYAIRRRVWHALRRDSTGLTAAEVNGWLEWLASHRDEVTESLQALRNLVLRSDADALDGLVSRLDTWVMAKPLKSEERFDLTKAWVGRIARLPDRRLRCRLAGAWLRFESLGGSAEERFALQVLERWWAGTSASWVKAFDSLGDLLNNVTLELLLQASDSAAFAAFLDRAPVWTVTGRCRAELVGPLGELGADPTESGVFRLRDDRPADSPSKWASWVVHHVPAPLVPAALARVPRQSLYDIQKETHSDVALILGQAGLGRYVVDWAKRKAEHHVEGLWDTYYYPGSEWDYYPDAVVFTLFDHLGEIDSEALLLIVAKERFSARGREAVQAMKLPFDLHFGGTLHGMSNDFWANLLGLLRNQALSDPASVLGSVMVRWLSGAPAHVLSEAMSVADDAHDAALRGRALADLFRLLVKRGAATEVMNRWFTRRAECDLFTAALAPHARRDEIIEAVRVHFLRAPPRQRDRIGHLGIALIGADFARHLLDWLDLVTPLSASLLAAALASAESCQPDLILRLMERGANEEWCLYMHESIHLFCQCLTLTDDAGWSRVAERLCSDSPGPLEAMLAVAVMRHEHDCGAGHNGSLASLACDALLRRFSVLDRDEVDVLLLAVAPNLHLIFDAESLGSLAADVLRCRAWWP